jgi:hypothetical protein
MHLSLPRTNYGEVTFYEEGENKGLQFASLQTNPKLNPDLHNSIASC